MNNETGGARLEIFKRSWTTEYRNQCRLLAEKYGFAGLRRLSAAELKKIFPPKAGQDVFDEKKFIICALLALKDEPNKEKSQIRGKIWYAILKAITHKVYGREAAEDIKFSINRMGLAYQYFSILDQLGEVTYTELNIINSGLQQEEFFDGYRNVILFVEDDDTFHKIKDACTVIGVKLISGGGSANTSNIEVLIQNCDLGEEHIILTLTDWDRYGETIAETFLTRCRVLGMKIKSHHHIGIVKEQITPEEFDEHRFRVPIAKKGKDKDKDLAWIKKNGEFGIELQALGQTDVDRLKEIVIDGLLKFCDETLLYDNLLESSFSYAPIEAQAEFMNSLTAKLKQAIETRAYEIFNDMEDDREPFDTGTLRENALEEIELIMPSKPVADKIISQLNDDVKDGTIDIKKLIGGDS